MPKSTSGYRIKSFIPIENMNIEKLRDSKSNPSKFSKVFLTWIQKGASLRCLLPPTLMFSFLQWFSQTSNNNKRQLDWQLQYLIIWSLNQESSLNLIYIIIVLGMSQKEGFHWPEKSLDKPREIDDKARISRKTEMKRKPDRNRKHKLRETST